MSPTRIERIAVNESLATPVSLSRVAGELTEWDHETFARLTRTALTPEQARFVTVPEYSSTDKFSMKEFETRYAPHLVELAKKMSAVLAA